MWRPILAFNVYVKVWRADVLLRSLKVKWALYLTKPPTRKEEVSLLPESARHLLSPCRVSISYNHTPARGWGKRLFNVSMKIRGGKGFSPG